MLQQNETLSRKGIDSLNDHLAVPFQLDRVRSLLLGTVELGRELPKPICSLCSKTYEFLQLCSKPTDLNYEVYAKAKARELLSIVEPKSFHALSRRRERFTSTSRYRTWTAVTYLTACTDLPFDCSKQVYLKHKQKHKHK